MTSIARTMARLSPALYLRLLGWLHRLQCTWRTHGRQTEEAAVRRYD
jgi:hypothetical protein